MILLTIDSLVSVEHTNIALVRVLTNKIRNDGFFTEPILVDKDTRIILNGHHRTEACKKLGFTKIPCIVVDYQGEITVTTSRGNKPVTKEYLLSRLSPFKTVNFPQLRKSDIIIPLYELQSNK